MSGTLTTQKDGKDRVWFYHEEKVEITDLQTALGVLEAVDFTSETPHSKRKSVSFVERGDVVSLVEAVHVIVLGESESGSNS